MTALEVSEALDIPGNGAGPVFLEPWHAEVFSLAVTLHRQGAFTWSDWAKLSADTLRDVPAGSGESVEAAYYRRWLLALETIVARKSLASVEEMARRKEEWRLAYLRTPHGLPVELKKRPAIEPHQTHNHSHDRRQASRPAPIAISPSRLSDAP